MDPDVEIEGAKATEARKEEETAWGMRALHYGPALQELVKK